EELARGPTAAIRMFAEEAHESLCVEPLRALRRRKPLAEREADRRVDLRKDREGAGPEALEQAAKLIGELNTGRDEVVTGPHQRPERLRFIRRLAERIEPVAVSAQE